MSHRPVRSLTRGLALIRELNVTGPSSAQQIAGRTGLNRTTCYRLLQTLHQDGFVNFDEEDALFRLTARIRMLSEGVSTRDLSSQAALPPMFALLQDVSWPSDFAVFELGSMVIRESTHSFSVLNPSLDGGPYAIAGQECARSRPSECRFASAQTRDARDRCNLGARGCGNRKRFWRHRPDRLAHKKGGLCVECRRGGAGHQRHRSADPRRRAGVGKPQHRLLQFGHDHGNRRPTISAEDDKGGRRDRKALVGGYRNHAARMSRCAVEARTLQRWSRTSQAIFTRDSRFSLSRDT